MNDFDLNTIDHFQSPYSDIYINSFNDNSSEEINLEGDFKLSHISIDKLNLSDESIIINYQNRESINLDRPYRINNFKVGDKEENTFVS